MQFREALPGPVDIRSSLEGFRHSGDDMVDRWDGETLVRTIPTPSGPVAYACTPAGSIEEPAFLATTADPSFQPAVEQALRSTFLLPPPEFEQLLRGDPVIARVNDLYPGIRPVLQFDLLGALIRSISSQQIDLSFAVVLRRRLAEAFGDRHEVAGRAVYSWNAGRLAAASPAAIRSLQFSTRKAEYLINAAQVVASGGLSLDELRSLPDEEAIGVAQSLLLYAFGRGALSTTP